MINNSKICIFNFLFFFLLLACQSEKNSSSGIPDEKNFSLLSSSATQIDFVNQVDDGEAFNVLTYRNFYNGGGVAIGDVNNDGLADIYLTANMEPNKLYLNKGNWQFEDISKVAGIEGSKAWSTGVSMADVNGDGWLDIYVCNSGDVAGDNKENELFINKAGSGHSDGIPTFVEKAAEYGLNDQGYSTHASFFDYDIDGDLDCYILNNSFKDPEKIEMNISTRSDHDNLGGDKLMRNDGLVFTDVTLEAGIYNSKIGFGLGVSVSDLNGDILPDIYISNDFWERDYLYLNSGDGTFSESLPSRISHCSVATMGSDLADLNNDGNVEIFTTDMLAADNYRLKAMTMFDPYHLEDLKYRSNFHYQILQNSLQLNNGKAEFQEIAHMSNVAATDWSWGALIFDFDNDGWKDIFVSNGIFRDIMYLDFTNFVNDQDEVKKVVVEKGNFDWRDFVEYIPSNPISNFAFINQSNNGIPTFENKAEELGLATPSFSNGSAYGDLDNDGDLDLVINNVNMPVSIYRNNSKNNYLRINLEGYASNPLGIGAVVKITSSNSTQIQQHFLSRGFESSVQPGLVFGMGKATTIDQLQVIWPDKKSQTITNVTVNQDLTLKYQDAKDNYTPEDKTVKPLYTNSTGKLLVGSIQHQENQYNDFYHELLLPKMLSTEGPPIIKGDVNGDGLEDFILGGATDYPDKLFLQNNDGWSQTTLPTISGRWKVIAETDKAFETTCGTIFDADGDGDNDILLGAGGNEYQKGINNFLLRYYENKGGGFFEKIIEKTPPAAGNFSVILSQDIDLDGDQDLFIGGRVVPGNYGLTPRSFLLRNDGNSSWTDISGQQIGSLGMVTDAVFSDINKDNLPDLIVVGDWLPVMVMENNGSSLTFSNKQTQKPMSGWWSAIERADLDNDGDDDYILGNWGLNSKFKASNEKPLQMFVKDFDNNGKSEFIINWYPPAEDEAFPFATKMDITQQLPHLKKENLKYEDYAHQTYQSLFSEEEREGAIAMETVTMASCIIWNEEGGLRLEELPLEAQVSPVFAIVAEDFNDDGIKDIWLGGNFYSLKPEVGRHDSNKGVFLQGTGNGKFAPIPNYESGIQVQGEVRDAVLMKKNGKNHLLLSRNNDEIIVFSPN